MSYVIRHREIVGDEWFTMSRNSGPWTDKFLDAISNGGLGDVFRKVLKNPDAEISKHPYIDYIRHKFNYSDTAIAHEIARIKPLVVSLIKNYDDKTGMLLESGQREGGGPFDQGPLSLEIADDGYFMKDGYIPDGFHRMVCLSILDKSFRVRVARRWPEWNQLKIDLYKVWNRKYLYQPIPHPDFDTWEVGHGKPDRFVAIANLITDVGAGKKVLDAGCHFGYLLYQLMKSGTAKSGAAFDFDALPLRVAKRLLSFVGVEPIREDAFKFFHRPDAERYSAVCAVSLVYHFIETYPIAKTINLLQRMVESSGLLVFDDAPVKTDWPEEVKRVGLVEFVNHVTNSKAVNFGRDSEFGRGLWAIWS